MNNKQNENILCFDVGSQTGCYGHINKTNIKWFDKFENITNKLILVLSKNKIKQLSIYFFEDNYGYTHVIKSLYFQKGVVSGIIKTLIKNQKKVKFFYINENVVFKFVLNAANKKREIKKFKSLAYYNQLHKKQIKNNDLSDAFILYEYSTKIKPFLGL